MAEVKPPIVPTYLYRYRSLTRSGQAVREEIDSILNRYIYCSDFSRMNDPMEGYYRPSSVLKGKTDYKEIVRDIANSKSGVGIACFTETHDDILMWAHYAGNYSGMCISYSTKELLAGLPSHVSLVRLSYVEKPPLVATNHVLNSDTAAVHILSQKKANWAYEREWRVLGTVGKVSYGRANAVKALYFGSRVDLQHRHEILAKLQGTSIKAYMMQVDGYENDWEPVNKAARPAKKQSTVKK